MRLLCIVFSVASTLHKAVSVSPQESINFVQSTYGNQRAFNSFPYLRNNFEKDFLSEIELRLELSQNSSSECCNDLSNIYFAIQNGSSWAYKFFDAWGKFPAGLMWGHFVELGNFDECLSIEHSYPSKEKVEVIRGQYCLANIPFGNTSDIVKNANIKLGICIPASCNATYINILMKKSISNIRKDVVISEILTQENCVQTTHNEFETIDWMAMGIFSFVGLLILCGTIYDLILNRQGDIPNQILSAFSLKVNLKYLFRTTSKKSPNVINCLHGIRCMSIIWVVFGHAYMMTMFLPNINTIGIIEWAHTPFSMFLQSGTICVDSFFFLSGLLLIWVSLIRTEENGRKLPLFSMYFHRYIRLTPVVAAAMLFSVSLYRHMGNGPLWNNFTASYKFCHDTWWYTLLYIQNYAAPGKMCVGHTWYLAVDMQLFVLSPLILIPIFKWKKRALAVVIILIISLIACVITTIVVNNFSVVTTIGNLGTDNERMRKVYYSTHSRAAPWLIGIIFGYFLFDNRNTKLNISMKTILCGWMLALALVAAVIFSLYPKMLPGSQPLTVIEGAFYLTLSRVAWPLALSWIVFACVNGYGGFANTFLSWTLWQPMSKLSYSMYITHLIIQTVHAGRVKVNLNFSNYDVIIRFWGDFGITLLVSIITFLMFESPLIGIERSLLEGKQNNCSDKIISNHNICFNES